MTLAIDFKREFLESNLALLLLPERTRELVEAASSRGSLRHFAGAAPVLELEGRTLGAPLEQPIELGVKSGGTPGVVVVFGIGLGHTIREVRAATDAPIVVYEPDPGLLRAALESGPTELGGVEIVCTLHDLTQLWTKLARGQSSATLIRSPGYKEMFPGAERELVSTVEQLVQRVGVNATTYRLRAREWISDLFANVDRLCESPSFQALHGRYRGVPAFIVGAGPSLGKNGKLLADAAKKGIVFAVNSSGRALASYGVEPQVLACLESIDVSKLMVDLPFIDRVVRAFSLSAHPQTFETGSGPILPVYEALPEVALAMDELTGLAGLPVCGSVSTLAFSLAQRLGCSPIVLVGQDLAYTGGLAYAPGSPYEASRARVSKDNEAIELDWCDTLNGIHVVGGNRMHKREPLRPVTAWGGTGEVASGISFSAVRAWFEAASDVLSRAAPDVALVNATEGGARIAGFAELTLDAVLKDLPERGITAESIARDAKNYASPISRAVLEKWAFKQADRVENVRRAARRLRRLAEHGPGVAASSPQKANRWLRSVQRAEHDLRQSVARAPVVDAWAYTAVDDVMDAAAADQPGADAMATAAAAAKREADVARAIENSALELGQILRELALRVSKPSQPA
jgi:hypothetical protein